MSDESARPTTSVPYEDQLKLIREFTKLTGIRDDQAAYVLNTFNWKFDVAVTSYFDQYEETGNVTNLFPSDLPQVQWTSNAGFSTMKPEEKESSDAKFPSKTMPKSVPSGASRGDVPASVGHDKPAGAVRGKLAAVRGKSAAARGKPAAARGKPAAVGRGKSAASSGIITFDSLRESKTETPDSDSDEEEGQAFYAGGSVNSGQQVLGPKKKEHGESDIVKNMFKDALSHGAEVVSSNSRKSATPRVIAFKGAGHILGQPGVTSQIVPSPSADEPEDVDISLKAWRNGFSVNDGPLRDYTDPKNKKFLDAVRNGQIPEELLDQINYGSQVHLNLEDHAQLDYMIPKTTLRAFTGAGHRLGSPTPPVAAAAQSAPDEEMKTPSENLTDANEFLNVDESQPWTMIQIRLIDGSKLVVKLNHTHTVNDIRRYIVIARPEYSASVFSLRMLYPNVELTNDEVTVNEAKLLNSVIVQKIN